MDSREIDLGFVVPMGPLRSDTNSFVDDMDRWLEHIGDRVAGLWVTDHLEWSNEPMFEAWTVLTFAAARWPRLPLGTVVLGQDYRNPGLLAKMAATLQCLATTSLVVGIGAGWKADEYESYGYHFASPGQRVAKLDETASILRSLWTQPGPVTVEGDHYRVINAHCEPKPDPIPTLMIGGGGDRTTLIAARQADWWSLPDCSPNVYAERLAVLERHCDTIGRDPHEIRRTWFGRLAVGRTEREAESLSDGEWTRANAIVGTVQQVHDRLDEFASLGVDYFTVDILGLDDPDIRALLTGDILPRFSEQRGQRP
ncbi:MAG: LLM class flavin-dependent oxidoreductase [Actinomycetota bacterium]|nr:LLM class flavin-dependent oxidoreductase [Actinomycetota bacterium]